MNRINKILEDLLDLEGPTTFKLYLTPKIVVNICKNRLSLNRDEVCGICSNIPDKDLSSWQFLQKHTDYDKFSALLLIALGEELKMWKRFPERTLSWNIPNWPYAIRECAGKKERVSRGKDVEKTPTNANLEY